MLKAFQSTNRLEAPVPLQLQRGLASSATPPLPQLRGVPGNLCPQALPLLGHRCRRYLPKLVRFICTGLSIRPSLILITVILEF